MRRPLIALALATSALALVVASRPAPVDADALYGAGSAGTWDFDQRCDDAAWSRTYSLWYILNDDADYAFDIPNPDLVAGESYTIELTPVVVGSLGGSVSLTGTTTLSGTIPLTNPHPGDTMWQDTLTDDEFTLAFDPGHSTKGSLPVPDEWVGTYVGFAALQAMITGDGGTDATIVMLAQPFSACDGPAPSSSPMATPSSTPSGRADMTLPPTDVATDTRVADPTVGRSMVAMISTIAAASLYILIKGERRRRR